MSLLSETHLRPAFKLYENNTLSHVSKRTFQVHTELDLWLKTADISSLIDNYSTIELVQIFTESCANAKYTLLREDLDTLQQTIVQRFAHFDADDGSAQNLSTLSIDELTTIAFACYAQYEQGTGTKSAGLYKCLAKSVSEKFQNEKAHFESAPPEKVALLLACMQKETYPLAKELFDLVREKWPFIRFERLSPKEQIFLFIYLHSKKNDDANFFDLTFMRFTELPQSNTSPFAKLGYSKALDLISSFPIDAKCLQTLIAKFEEVFLPKLQTSATIQYILTPFSGTELYRLVIMKQRVNLHKQEPLASAITEELLSQNARRIDECIRADKTKLFHLIATLAEMGGKTETLISTFEKCFQKNFVLEQLSTTQLLLTLQSYLEVEKNRNYNRPDIPIQLTTRPFFTALINHLVKSHTWKVTSHDSQVIFFTALDAIADVVDFTLKDELLGLYAGILLSSEQLLQNCCNTFFVFCLMAFAGYKYKHKALFDLLESTLLQKGDDGKSRLEKITSNWKLLQNVLNVCHLFNCFSKPISDLLIQYTLPHGIVAFEHLCSIGWEKFILELLKQGFDAKKTDAKKNGALYFAIFYQQKQVLVELLKRAPSDVNKTNNSGNSLLHITAGSFLNISNTKLLLDHGADATKRNTIERLPPFCIASEKFSTQTDETKLKIIQFYSYFFQGFDQVIAYLQQPNYESLILFFETNPNAGKFKAGMTSEGEPINPLEVTYFMQSPAFAQKVCDELSLAEGQKYLAALTKKYPQATDWAASVLFCKAYREKNEEFALLFADQMSVQGLNKYNILALAVEHTSFKVVHTLCQRKINVSQSNSQKQTPLHIACMKGLKESAKLLLQKRASLNLLNQSTHTAFQAALKSPLWLSTPQQMSAFFTHFLKGFPQLLKRIENHQGENFSEYFSTYPEFLIEEPHVSRGVNPLFVPFLFNDIKIAKVLFIRLGQERFHKMCALLKKQYPAADLDSIEFAGYDLNRQHIAQKVQEDIPDKPADAKLDEIVDFFKEVNFQDKKKSPYFDPETYGLHDVANTTFAEQLNSNFVRVIKEQKVSMPPPEPEARKKFYRDVENALCLTARAVKTTDQKAALLGRCSRLIGVCAGGILPVCMNLFNEYVKGMAATFEQALFELLGDYRKMLLESLLPAGRQNTHHFLMLFYPLSKKEELNLPYAKTAYDDRIIAANAVDTTATKTRFFQKYTASAIIPFIERQIMQDGEFRNRYLDYWKKQLPNQWREVVYEDVETATLSRSLMVKALEQQGVVAPGKACEKASRSWSLWSWLDSCGSMVPT